jgi:ribonuclease P/MRP protein subunit RPP1
MNFFACGLHALPDGSDSPSRLAFVARRLGYSGMVICNHTGTGKPFGKEAARKVDRIEVGWGIEVVANNPRVLHSRITSMRDQTEFLAVHGGPDSINRAACEDSKVDMLAHPEDGRRSLSIVAARAASDNKVAIGFDMRPMIQLRGSARSRWLNIFHRNLLLARKFDLEIIITTEPRSHFDLRAPREMIAMAKLAGMEEWEAEAALRYPKKILELNRKRWAGPGVELV